MKTLLKTTLAFCLSLAFLTQGFCAEEKMTKKDHIMMKNGKMMVQKNGKVTTMEKDMALENGTTVNTDGTVVGEKRRKNDA